MATSSSHRLIMEKEEIQDFFCLVGDIWIFFSTEMFIEYSLRVIRLFKSVHLMVVGLHKGSIFVKVFKNLLLRNHKGDEAETWHTYFNRTLASI